MLDIPRLWAGANLEERRKLLLTMPDAVHVVVVLFLVADDQVVGRTRRETRSDAGWLQLRLLCYNLVSSPSVRFLYA